MQYSNILNVLPSVRNHKSGAALAAGVLATGLLLGPGMASAATVLTTGDDQEIATNILNLDVGGALYDVEFLHISGNDLYGTAPRTYDFDNLTDAHAALTAINTELNNWKDRPLVGSVIQVAGGPINNSDQYFIGYADSSGGVGIAKADNFDTTLTAAAWDYNGADSRPGGTAEIYADFSTSVIPVPAAVWLFGSGLLGLVGVARRKKSA